MKLCIKSREGLSNLLQFNPMTFDGPSTLDAKFWKIWYCKLKFSSYTGSINY